MNKITLKIVLNNAKTVWNKNTTGMEYITKEEDLGAKQTMCGFFMQCV